MSRWAGKSWATSDYNSQFYFWFWSPIGKDRCLVIAMVALRLGAMTNTAVTQGAVALSDKRIL